MAVHPGRQGEGSRPGEVTVSPSLRSFRKEVRSLGAAGRRLRTRGADCCLPGGHFHCLGCRASGWHGCRLPDTARPLCPPVGGDVCSVGLHSLFGPVPPRARKAPKGRALVLGSLPLPFLPPAPPPALLRPSLGPAQPRRPDCMPSCPVKRSPPSVLVDLPPPPARSGQGR